MQLSLITINYNNREGLKKTIDSVVAQTFKDFEWIVIDGGSTDGSRELLEEYAEYFAYWVSEPDKGIYNAMNKGIKKAKGEYLLFLNSGDYLYDKEVLSRVLDAGLDTDVVYGYIMVDKGGCKEIVKNPNEITLGTFVFGTINHSGCSLIRRNLFYQFGLYDESLKIVSDWKFFLQAIGLGPASVKYIDVLISVFDGGGIGTTNTVLCDMERELVLNECVPSRILRDYKKMEMERILHIQREQAIKFSITYRIGQFILFPIKLIKKLFVK